jgi:hypothetical protein
MQVAAIAVLCQCKVVRHLWLLRPWKSRQSNFRVDRMCDHFNATNSKYNTLSAPPSAATITPPSGLLGRPLQSGQVQRVHHNPTHSRLVCTQCCEQVAHENCVTYTRIRTRLTVEDGFASTSATAVRARAFG